MKLASGAISITHDSTPFSLSDICCRSSSSNRDANSLKSTAVKYGPCSTAFKQCCAHNLPSCCSHAHILRKKSNENPIGIKEINWNQTNENDSPAKKTISNRFHSVFWKIVVIRLPFREISRCNPTFCWNNCINLLFSRSIRQILN